MNLFRKNSITERSYSIGYKAWHKFKKDKLAMSALFIIILVFLVSIFAYLIVPDNTPNSNRQMLEIGGKKPGFSVNMLKIRKNEQKNKPALINRMFVGSDDEYYFVPFTQISILDNHVEIVKYTGWDTIKGIRVNYKLEELLFYIDKQKPILYSGKNVVFFNHNGKKNESLY